MVNYKVMFFGRQGRLVSKRMIACEGHWEACEWAWKHKPAQAGDFHIEEADHEHDPEAQRRKDDETISAAFHILRKRAGMIKLP
ncbi:hypothetical protein EOA23_12125 [Mesorhizobium sp. M2A.F.Ca.ET.042.01.1.1]|uniref:hypothetical protein n=1 Tax=Mesorhizobium sp. M2A.F.Ca.ET.042.01.1.1 TaxID=2496745 RepID=UPI000FCC6393|nr:hypothetical protein [Mesorhizobium sp. M2A.F.Ca.ET.042.01.1.1]RUX30376.1 hypothetical protein EOA23_12125 [Mesorhizobium sp. M2A.F.Ca.ET.042.01.1.1]